ncbi:MAG: group 1 truncated hemoglobin [Chitinophagaceae bacterium]|nr:group 1 truncated hemoglobin [Oligoflexus sp.]
MPRNLYDEIGPDRIAVILKNFYERCFEDVMIGHFFFEKNHDELLKHQLNFATGMLGGPVSYQGRPLAPLHQSLPIRSPHFARRRQILIETMTDFGLAQNLIDGWVALEERLKPLILQDSGNCRS